MSDLAVIITITKTLNKTKHTTVSKKKSYSQTKNEKNSVLESKQETAEVAALENQETDPDIIAAAIKQMTKMAGLDDSDSFSLSFFSDEKDDSSHESTSLISRRARRIKERRETKSEETELFIINPKEEEKQDEVQLSLIKQRQRLRGDSPPQKTADTGIQQDLLDVVSAKSKLLGLKVWSYATRKKEKLASLRHIKLFQKLSPFEAEILLAYGLILVRGENYRQYANSWAQPLILQHEDDEALNAFNSSFIRKQKTVTPTLGLKANQKPNKKRKMKKKEKATTEEEKEICLIDYGLQEKNRSKLFDDYNKQRLLQISAENRIIKARKVEQRDYLKNNTRLIQSYDALPPPDDEKYETVINPEAFKSANNRRIIIRPYNYYKEEDDVFDIHWVQIIEQNILISCRTWTQDMVTVRAIWPFIVVERQVYYADIPIFNSKTQFEDVCGRVVANYVGDCSDYTKLSKLIATQWKRSNMETSDLEQRIFDYMSSDVFMETLERRRTQLHDALESRTRAGWIHTRSADGHSQESYEYARWKKNFFLAIKLLYLDLIRWSTWFSILSPPILFAEILGVGPTSITTSVCSLVRRWHLDGRARDDYVSGQLNRDTQMKVPFVQVCNMGIEATEDNTEMKDFPDIDPTVVLKWDGDMKEEYADDPQVYKIQGMIPSDNTMQIPRDGNKEIYSGLRRRMCLNYSSDPKYLEGFVKFAEKFILSMDDIDVSCTYEEKLKHLRATYGFKKGTRLAKLIDEPYNRKDLSGTMFVKKEVYNKAEGKMKPRIIVCRTEKVVAKNSCWSYKVGKYFSTKLFGPDCAIHYCSGATPDQVGQSAQRLSKRPHRYCADVSSWDGSLSEDMINIEKFFMRNKLVGLPDDFDYLLDEWENWKASSYDKKLSVSMKGRRRSGDVTTSWGNSLLNVLITAYVNNVDPNSDKLSMLVMGDDNVVGKDEPYDHDTLVDNYSRLGMVVKVQDLDDFDNADFCSGYFYPVNGQLRYGNFFWKVLSKLRVDVNKNGDRLSRELILGTMMGLMCTANHVPVIGAIIRAVVKSGKANKIKPRKPPGRWSGRIQGGLVIDPAKDTYSYFSKMYDMPLYKIYQLEQWITENITIDSFPCMFVDKDLLRVYHENVKEWDGVGQLKTFYNTGIKDSDLTPFEYDSIYKAPRREEMYKLNRCKSLAQALLSARKFGQRENAAYQANNRVILHSIFTFISYFNLEAGIKAHSDYNAWIIANHNKSGVANMGPKRFKKKKRSRKKRRKPRGKYSKMGMTVGSAFGGPTGAAVGGLLGGAADLISGNGDYTVRKNSLAQYGGKPLPSFGSAVNRYSREFYIADVYSSTDFNSVTYNLNPGNSLISDWLAGQASGWQEYLFHGLGFQFRSSAGNAFSSSNNAQGMIIMMTQYNLNDPIPTSKKEMENSVFAISAKPSVSFMHWVECDLSKSPYTTRYVRHGEILPSQDINSYDWGRFCIATQGMQVDNVNLGELWMVVDIELMLPRMNPISTNLICRIANHDGNTDDPFGVQPLGYGGNLPIELGRVIGSTGLDTAFFPQELDSGTFLIVINWSGPDGSSVPNISACHNFVINTTGWGWDRDVDYVQTRSTPVGAIYLALGTIIGRNSCFTVNYPRSFTAVDMLVMAVPGPQSLPIQFDTPTSLAFGAPAFRAKAKMELARAKALAVRTFPSRLSHKVDYKTSWRNACLLLETKDENVFNQEFATLTAQSQITITNDVPTTLPTDTLYLLSKKGERIIIPFTRTADYTYFTVPRSLLRLD